LTFDPQSQLKHSITRPSPTHSIHNQSLLVLNSNPTTRKPPRNKMAATNGDTPKIILYTNHRCPWAHRAHIAIKELGLPYEEVIIDLDTPREPWYLEINPVST
jgi:hypothetical protein